MTVKLCIGLDVSPQLENPLAFLSDLVDNTYYFAYAYKINLAYFAVRGSKGFQIMELLIDHIRSMAPNALIIGDGKHGDVEHTNDMYAQAMFGTWKFDAATVNPWAGLNALEPFLHYPNKIPLVWCRSSNQDGETFQTQRISYNSSNAEFIAGWAKHNGAGLVAGKDVASIRRMAPVAPILVPGIGTQGGNLEEAIRADAIVSISRRILDAANPGSTALTFYHQMKEIEAKNEL